MNDFSNSRVAMVCPSLRRTIELPLEIWSGALEVSLTESFVRPLLILSALSRHLPGDELSRARGPDGVSGGRSDRGVPDLLRSSGRADAGREDGSEKSSLGEHVFKSEVKW